MVFKRTGPNTSVKKSISSKLLVQVIRCDTNNPFKYQFGHRSYELITESGKHNVISLCTPTLYIYISIYR